MLNKSPTVLAKSVVKLFDQKSHTTEDSSQKERNVQHTSARTNEIRAFVH